MMTIDDMPNIKDTILNLRNTHAWIAMIIDDTSKIKDVIFSLEEININNGDHKWNVEHYGHTIELWKTQT